MKKEILFASFWLNYGILLSSQFRIIPNSELIPNEPDCLPAEWYVIQKKLNEDDKTVSNLYLFSKNAANPWTYSHDPINANWLSASRGMVIVSDDVANIYIPPELNTASRKKRLLEILDLDLNLISNRMKHHFHVDQRFKGGPIKAQEEIPVDITENGEMLCVCDHCRCSNIPHFTWYSKRGRPIQLMLEKAMPLDPHVNMELRERKRLQQCLTASNWLKLLREWNEHNTHTVSYMQHVPNYINLQEKVSTYSTVDSTVEIRKGSKVLAEVFIDLKDTDKRPHFHYLRPNGIELMISLTDARYFEPVPEKLNHTEKLALAEWMEKPWPGDLNGFSVYERLWFDWASIDDYLFYGNEKDVPMPDYTKLTKGRTDKNE